VVAVGGGGGALTSTLWVALLLPASFCTVNVML
jgi:hypothetical protein